MWPRSSLGARRCSDGLRGRGAKDHQRSDRPQLPRSSGVSMSGMAPATATWRRDTGPPWSMVARPWSPCSSATRGQALRRTSTGLRGPRIVTVARHDQGQPSGPRASRGSLEDLEGCDSKGWLVAEDDERALGLDREACQGLESDGERRGDTALRRGIADAELAGHSRAASMASAPWPSTTTVADGRYSRSVSSTRASRGRPSTGARSFPPGSLE